MAIIRIFVVFHRALDERLIFNAFREDEVERWFVRYAVNSSYPEKRIIRRDGHIDNCTAGTQGVILEYELECYFPELQSRGFMETSCYVHTEANNLLSDADLIGVCQYDMRWPEQAASLLRQLNCEPASQRFVYGLSVGPMINQKGVLHPFMFAERRDWLFLLKSYNQFFSTSWQPEILVDKPLTLWQTYILPRSEFSELSRWLRLLCSEVFPWATQPPYETHWGTLGGYTERAASLFIAARIHEEKLSLRHLPLHHDPAIPKAMGIDKMHYGL